ncbi:hypothetical protein [Sodalis-like endosymbiont of Proechinophthirus fluctus]|uniref:hypothetical protein n=1 Tax=Sodalis-like endosymbiont of Proechinophthirus fluctus TaxID=1462730 RepID=UPI0016504F3A|nr:hypothetical protein [Sodalis-like endosymbiont of Proechinophthirus fluctus]
MLFIQEHFIPCRKKDMFSGRQDFSLAEKSAPGAESVCHYDHHLCSHRPYRTYTDDGVCPLTGRPLENLEFISGMIALRAQHSSAVNLASPGRVVVSGKIASKVLLFIIFSPIMSSLSLHFSDSQPPRADLCETFIPCRNFHYEILSPETFTG